MSINKYDEQKFWEEVDILFPDIEACYFSEKVHHIHNNLRNLAISGGDSWRELPGKIWTSLGNTGCVTEAPTTGSVQGENAE